MAERNIVVYLDCSECYSEQRIEIDPRTLPAPLPAIECHCRFEGPDLLPSMVLGVPGFDATGYIAVRDDFWKWVYSRRAQDNPRGDFIRDTRVVMDAGARSPDEALWGGCIEARVEHDRLWRQYARENSVPKQVRNDFMRAAE